MQWRPSVASCAQCRSKISPSEGAGLATLIKSYADAIDLADVVKRLDSLEAKILEVQKKGAA